MAPADAQQTFHLHLVSDATGETINGVARACLAQFEDVSVQEYFWNLIRSPKQLELAMMGISRKPGLVLYTFVDENLRRDLEAWCRDYNIPCLSLLDPVLQSLANFFGRPFAHQPGKQHRLDAEYFARIEAMDYAMALDDGQGGDHLAEADVVVLGVSRTSKTPTCLYLAGRGVKAANVPVVPGCPLPPALETLAGKLIVGLTKDPHSLVEIRLNRLKLLHGDRSADYVDIEKVKEEVVFARRLFSRLGCPVIDVSRRSIEETAAEIMMLLSAHKLKGETTA
ncbi:MAG: pyruvate, water dikinase regulatory protein [Alphaproteobacteria bacterium]